MNTYAFYRLVLSGALTIALCLTTNANQSNSSNPKNLVLQPLTAKSQRKKNALKEAEVIFVDVCTDFMSKQTFERDLLLKPEFQKFGLIISRDEKEADLVVQITRKTLSTWFTISLIDPVSNHVLASDRATSLGGTIEPKLADQFIQIIKKARTESQSSNSK